MRLTFVLPSLRRGGAETSVAQLVRDLHGRGIDPQVITLDGPYDLEDRLTAMATPVVRAPALPTRRAQVSWLRARLRTDDPDLVHTSVFEADLVGRTAARLASIPVSSSIINVMYGRSERARMSATKVRGAQLADALTARWAGRLHAVSSHAGDVMSSRLLYPRDRIDVVPRSRDPDLLGRRTHGRRAAVRARLGIEEHESIVLAVGRLEVQKGFDVALEVGARLPTHARLVIAGAPGRARGQLEAQAQVLGLPWSSIWIGERSDIADLMVAADVLLFPSRWEGLPGTLIEALLLELPIAANDIPQVREATDGATSVLLARDNGAAEHLTNIATLLRERPGTGEGQSWAAERFAPARVAVQMSEFFTNAAAGRPG